MPAGLGYSDRGEALARLVLAGTAPVDSDTGQLITRSLITGDVPATPVSAANLVKIVDWIAAAGPPPIAVESTTHRWLGPWIGSVRSAGLDGPVARHVHLDEGAVRRVLGAGMRFDVVRSALTEVAWSWAAREARRLARAPLAGSGFDAMGSVIGIVSTESHDARADSEARRDVVRGRQRALWSRVQGYLSKPLPGPARAAVGLFGSPARNAVLPSTERELEYWRDHRDLSIGREALAFEYLLLATLWEERETNGYFAVGAEPPPRALVHRVDEEVYLRPLVELDEDGVEAYLRWRSDLAANGPAPLQLAAERFFAEGREEPA
jgi:hypothetical protein